MQLNVTLHFRSAHNTTHKTKVGDTHIVFIIGGTANTSQ